MGGSLFSGNALVVHLLMRFPILIPVLLVVGASSYIPETTIADVMSTFAPATVVKKVQNPAPKTQAPPTKKQQAAKA